MKAKRLQNLEKKKVQKWVRQRYSLGYVWKEIVEDLDESCSVNSCNRLHSLCRVCVVICREVL